MRRLGDQALQFTGQGLMVVRRDENRGAGPEFAQAGQIAQHQGAAGQGGFQDRQAERLVAGGQGEDAGVAI